MTFQRQQWLFVWLSLSIKALDWVTHSILGLFYFAIVGFSTGSHLEQTMAYLPSHALMDFEVTMRAARTEPDPTHHVRGCLFHLTQVLKPWHTVYLWPKKIRSMRRILSTILVAISQFLQTKSESNNRSVCSRALSIFWWLEQPILSKNVWVLFFEDSELPEPPFAPLQL